MDKPMMGCGHSANATDAAGHPVCVICYGIVKGATEVVGRPVLEGRRAKCPYCKGTTPSSTELPFFEHCPSKEFDSYYCGCRGWD